MTAYFYIDLVMWLAISVSVILLFDFLALRIYGLLRPKRNRALLHKFKALEDDIKKYSVQVKKEAEENAKMCDLIEQLFEDTTEEESLRIVKQAIEIHREKKSIIQFVQIPKDRKATRKVIFGPMKQQNPNRTHILASKVHK